MLKLSNFHWKWSQKWPGIAPILAALTTFDHRKSEKNSHGSIVTPKCLGSVTKMPRSSHGGRGGHPKAPAPYVCIYIYIYVTAFNKFCTRHFLKIGPSRFSSRTLHGPSRTACFQQGWKRSSFHALGNSSNWAGNVMWFPTTIVANLLVMPESCSSVQHA